MISNHVEVAEALVLKVSKLLECARIADAKVGNVEVSKYTSSITTRVKLDLGGNTKLHLYLDEPVEESK